MQTPYDWITIALFAALIVLFLHRSSMDNPPDRVWHYLPPALGCSIANYLGNEGYGPIPVAGVLFASIVYVWIVLRPGKPRR